jgi:hypothetical protein
MPRFHLPPCHTHCWPEVTAATLALVKAFLAIRVHTDFVRPHRPLIYRGDLSKQRPKVADAFKGWVEALPDAAVFDLLRAGDALLMEDLQVGAT